MLYLSQGWIVYVFIFLVMPFLLSIRSYVWGRGGYAFLNRNNIGTLKGIAILLIVMQSVGERLTHATPLMASMLKVGTLGSILYLFTCVYEWMSVYRKSKRQVKKLFYHQVPQLLFLFIGVNVLEYLVMMFQGNEVDLRTIVYQTVGTHFFDGSSAWLLGATLYFYTAFYVSYRTRFKMKLLGVFSLIYAFISLKLDWNATVAFCFLIGAFCCQYQYYLFRMIRYRFSTFLAGTTLVFLLSYGWYLRGGTLITWGLPYIFIAFLLCLLMKLQCRSSFFKTMGVCGMEVYMIHSLLLVLLLGYRGGGSLMQFLLFLLALPLSAGGVKVFLSQRLKI